MLDGLWERFEAIQLKRVSRRMRRLTIVVFMVTVLLYFGMAFFTLFPLHIGSHWYGPASCIWALMAMGYAVFWLRYLRRVTSAMSLDERAQMEFGKNYAELKPRHRFDVRVRVGREVRQGGGPRLDERDAGMQREAERLALRVLRIGLPIFVAVYWMVCLCLPVGLVRVGLLIGAVVMSGVAIPVIILPDLIRLWSEPDQARELRVVLNPQKGT